VFNGKLIVIGSQKNMSVKQKIVMMKAAKSQAQIKTIQE